MFIGKMKRLFASFLALGLANASQAVLFESSSHQPCSAKHLTPSIDIPNKAKLLQLIAVPLRNVIVENYPTFGSETTISFCNVTVTYTHPSFHDQINININLPLTGWNGRFQGIGGSGYAANAGAVSLQPGVAEGYSTGNTDAGHVSKTLSSSDWAFKPNGELNIPLLEDFAYFALEELAIVGKQVSNRHYGHGPHYSYWNGCSTGGHQGLMMAQRYPDLYNGIYTASPAIHWETFIVAEYWGQFQMNKLNHYPPSCAFDTITAAAVTACDGLDGVIDGVIANLEKCHYNPKHEIGKQANCTDGPYTITAKDVEIVSQTWQGPRNEKGEFVWYGLNRGAVFEGLVNTTCTEGVTNCTGFPFGISYDWIVNWVLAKPDYDLTKTDLSDYLKLFPSAYKQYHSLIGTEIPNLSAFKKAGGKMITWHGLADQLIFTGGIESYYSEVENGDHNVRDYYRFFPAPGVGHCGGGAGEVPSNPFQAVVDWVEKGDAPETLPAVSTDGSRSRNLCQFPLVSVYESGDPTKAGSFRCQREFPETKTVD